MPTVFLNAVFKPFLKNRPWHGPTTDDRSDEFPDWWLPSNNSTYGVCECKHAISNTAKGKNHTLKDRESEGATARLRNGKWGARETCFEQWSLTSLQCALWHHLVESDQPRGKECQPPRPPLLGLPTEYYPFKRCQVPVGHSVDVISDYWENQTKNMKISNGVKCRVRLMLYRAHIHKPLSFKRLIP